MTFRVSQEYDMLKADKKTFLFGQASPAYQLWQQGWPRLAGAEKGQ